MKHFLRYHKATSLTATPQLFQTLLPITNVEEAEIAEVFVLGINTRVRFPCPAMAPSATPDSPAPSLINKGNFEFLAFEKGES